MTRMVVKFNTFTVLPVQSSKTIVVISPFSEVH